MSTRTVIVLPWHLRVVSLSLLAVAAHAQSTLGSISGTVQDSTGAVIPNATIRLHGVENGSDFSLTTDSAGIYTALNIAPGLYDLSVTAAGFPSITAQHLAVLARQQLRYDVIEHPGAASDQVTVSAADAGAIDTENAQISAALSSRAVLDLPANYRGAGSTSPVSVIQTLPGVQPDSGAYPPAASSSPSPQIKFSIQGGLPSQSETTIDGISAQNPEQSAG